MNFLAHLYLSGKNQGIQIGNFIGDHVKGKDYLKYAPDIQKGILLHRKIDYFTDRHPLVKQSTSRLNEKYRRYSGIIIDVFYDHLLARYWNQYSEDTLSKYVSTVHKVLLKNYFKLPGSVKRFLPFMLKSRRLETYATTEGIERSLKIMSAYSSLPDHTSWAMKQLDIHHSDMKQEFEIFFQEIQLMCEKELETL